MKVKVSVEFDSDTTDQDIEDIRLDLIEEARHWLNNDPDEAEISVDVVEDWHPYVVVEIIEQEIS